METTVDVSEMYAIHDVMRKEYGSLPLLVKSIPDGDAERAALVGDHIALLDQLMRVHHDGEDEVLWPLVRERAPEHEAIFVMDSEHALLNSDLDHIGDLAAAWRADPSATNRAALHTALIQFEKVVLKHLGHEEREVLPVLQQTLTQEEYDRLGAYVRERVGPEQGGLILGLILEDTTESRGSAVLAAMDPADREALEQTVRPAAQEYKRRLLEM